MSLSLNKIFAHAGRDLLIRELTLDSRNVRAGDLFLAVPGGKYDGRAHIADALQHAIGQRGRALLAVSGGKSPIALFERLREQALDWRAVTVILVDERCVPHEHTDSNTALVRQHLLQGPAAAARFLNDGQRRILLVDDDVLSPVEADPLERHAHEVADRNHAD